MFVAQILQLCSALTWAQIYEMESGFEQHGTVNGIF
jgi:hypothetical protein